MANDNEKTKALEFGDVTEEGWAYVGVDKGSGQNVFARAYGVEGGKSYLTEKWKEAIDIAANQKAHLGSDAELGLLQKNIINKGLLRSIFDVNGTYHSGWVWGSRKDPKYPEEIARIQRLSDGLQGWDWQDNQEGQASVVLFRTEPRP